MNTMTMLIKREFWENRSLYIAPLVIAGLIVLSSAWAVVAVHDVGHDSAVRIHVSVILQDYPGRDVIAMSSGTATLSGDHDLSHASAGIEAAITSGLRSIPGAMHE